MKLRKKIIGLTLGLALTLGVGFTVNNSLDQVLKVEAATVTTITPADAKTVENEAFTVTKGGVQLSCTQGTNNSSEFRIFKSQSITLESTDDSFITKVIFTATANGTAKYGPGCFKGDNYVASSGKTGTWSLDAGAKKFTLTASTNQVRLTKLEVTTMATTSDPRVSIKDVDTLNIGSKGTLTAEAFNATNPVFAWASSDPEILSIDAQTGAYEAKSVGIANITVSMTCDEASTPVTASTELVVNYGLVTIAKANEIAAPLGDSETSTLTLTIKGYITNLDADGKTRMLTISDKRVGEEGANTINIYGVYPDSEFRKTANLNGTVTVTAHPAKYKGDIQLSNPTLTDYKDGTLTTFAKESNLKLDAECAELAVKEETWNAIAVEYAKLDAYDQARLKAAKATDSDKEIADFVARYDLIVAKYKYTNFMEKALSAKANALNNGVSTLTIVSIISIVAILGATLLIIKAKKAKKQ